MYFADGVQETTTTTGTGNIALAGATVRHFAFSADVFVGDQFEYSIFDANGTDREDGLATLVDSTHFSRDVVFKSTNSGSKINLSSGTHTVFLTQTANAANKRMVFADVFIDFVATGLITPTTSGTLAGTISAGVAYVVGQRIVKGAQAHTYTASKDTYVDLDNTGLLTYVAVSNGAGAPAITANSIRLGKVVTGSSAITGGTDLRNLYRQPVASVENSASQTIASGPPVTDITFDTQIVNNDGMHSTASHSERITAVHAGLYLVQGTSQWAGVASVQTAILRIIHSSGKVYGANQIITDLSANYGSNVSGLVPMAAGEYVKLQVFQNSGGNLDTYTDSATKPTFSATRL